VLSRRVANNEPALTELIDAVQAGADDLTWAIDLANGPAALMITLLLQRNQKLVYLPGIGVNRASQAYRGESNTDLLTELSGRCFGWFVQGPAGLASLGLSSRLIL
jgi:hypothetical protein